MPIGAFRLNTLGRAMAVANSISATGGTTSYYATGGIPYKVHTFTTTGSNNFVVTATGTPTVDILLVGGGAAGGGVTSTTTAMGGGGGGGAVVYQTGVSVSSQTYTISVGAGGNGVLNGNGQVGASTTGLGYTANGGGRGTQNSAATDGGGSGTSSSSSFTSTAGTYAYKGGNSFGSATVGIRAAGGGAGAGGAGQNATSSTGGAGGVGIQNNIDGQNRFYSPGGGGSGTSTGGNSGAGNTDSDGSGRTSSGTGYTATVALSGYGAGGGGANNEATTAFAGGAGSQGISVIRYPTSDDFIIFRSSGTSGTTSITVPTVENGDIGILIQAARNTSGQPTAVNPSGWTSILNSAGGILRIQAHYKILTAAESATSITTMSGTSANNSALYIFRPSRTYTLSIASLNQQATTAAPTNQTLTMTSVTGPYLGIAFNYASASNTDITSTTTPTIYDQAIWGNRGNIIIFQSTSSADSFTTSTISMVDRGDNGLASFRLVLT